MKRTEYPIHPDFKRWSNMNPPLNAVVVPLLQASMKGLLDLEKSGKGVAVERRSYVSQDGAVLRTLLYTPESVGAGAPALVYCHGGGFVIPAAPYHYALAREYAQRAQCRVLFPEYRLAPGHAFPTAAEDCWAAYRALLRWADSLGVDTERIAVGGDSAGATLALDICLMARRRGGVPMPIGMLLVYPSTGAEDTESMKAFTDTPMCNSRDMDKYGKLYLQNAGAGVAEDAWPIRTETVEGLPQAYVETAEFDALRDGGILFAQRLQQAGIPAELWQTKGTIHGFDIEMGSSIVRECVDRRVAFLQRIFQKEQENSAS